MASRNLLYLKDKIELINLQETEKLTVRELAKRFNIGKTQAAEIIKNKVYIKAKWQSGINLQQRRISLTPQGSKVDQLCYDWYAMAASSERITGTQIKAKAKEIAEQVGYAGFLASNGWLEKWMKRHNINLRSTSGESSGDVRPTKSKQFKKKLPPAKKPQDTIESDIFLPKFGIKSKHFIDVDEIDITSTDEEITQCDSDLELDVLAVTSIYSYEEALKQITRLKEFASGDFYSSQLLSKLGMRFEELQRKGVDI